MAPRLLADAPDARVAGRPVVEALAVLAPRRHVRDEDRREIRQLGPSELLQLGVDLGPLLGLGGLPPRLAQPVVLGVLEAGVAGGALVGLAVVDVGVGPRRQAREEEGEAAGVPRL